jgi:hypothetical protein
VLPLLTITLVPGPVRIAVTIIVVRNVIGGAIAMGVTTASVR